jgi:hypothetical protein
MTEDRIAKITEALSTGDAPELAWMPQESESLVGDSSLVLMASLRHRGVLLGASAGGTIQEVARSPAEPAAALEAVPGELPSATAAPRLLLLELHQAYETAQAAERAIERQQAYVRQRYTALVAQLASAQHQARSARDRGAAHHALNAVMGLHDHVAELQAQWQWLQRQRDVKTLAVLATGAAYREGCEEARRLRNALRLSQQAAAALPPALAALELDHATQLQAQLVALLGESEAQALVQERT